MLVILYLHNAYIIHLSNHTEIEDINFLSRAVLNQSLLSGQPF